MGNSVADRRLLGAEHIVHSTQGYVPSTRQDAFVQFLSQPPQQQIRGPWQLTHQQQVQSSPPPPLPAHQHNVTHDNLRQYLNPDDSVNINKDFDLSALVPHDDNNN